MYSLVNYWWANVGKRMEKGLRQCSVGFLDTSVDDLIVEENLSVEKLVDALDKLSHIALLVVHEKPSVAARLRKKVTPMPSKKASNGTPDATGPSPFDWYQMRSRALGRRPMR